MARTKQADRIAALESAVAKLIELVKAKPVAVATETRTTSVPAFSRVPASKLTDAQFRDITAKTLKRGFAYAKDNGCELGVWYLWSPNQQREFVMTYRTTTVVKKAKNSPIDPIHMGTIRPDGTYTGRILTAVLKNAA